MCDEWIIVFVTSGSASAGSSVAFCVDDVDVDTAELARTRSGGDMAVSLADVLFAGVGTMLAVTFMCPAIETSL
jgi:hypothetical protein